MKDDERTPLVAGGEARASEKAGGLNLGKTAWSFCMGLIIVALAVLGTVLAFGSARGGLARRHEARFFTDGFNESGAAFASMDYDYAHDMGRLEEAALGDAQPPLLDPVLEEADASPEAMKARRVARRTAHRVANRERAEREEREKAEKEAAAAAAAAEAAAAERLRLAARTRRVRARRIARGEVVEPSGGSEEKPQPGDRPNASDEPSNEPSTAVPTNESAETTAEDGAVSDGRPDREEARAARTAEGTERASPAAPDAASTTAAPDATSTTAAPDAASTTAAPDAASATAPTPARATRGDILAAASAAVARAEGKEGPAKDEDASTPTPTPVIATPAPFPATPPASPPPLSAQDLLDALEADAQPRPPPAPYPPLPPSPPPSSPPPPPPMPRPPHPPARPPVGQPPAAFRSLVPLPGIVAEVGPVTAPPASGAATTRDAEGNAWTSVLTRDDADARGASPTLESILKTRSSEEADATADEGEEDVSFFGDDVSPTSSSSPAGHLGVVSAFWEDPLREDGRWHSARKDKTPDYYRRGLGNLVRAAARSRNSVVVYTAETSNECQALESAYAEGASAYADKSAAWGGSGNRGTDAPRFLCVKLPLQNLHYGDWHLADHSLVKNMPCSEKMRDTKLIWLNKINLVESAAHMLALPGGKKATRMEWVDADLYAERDDLAANLGGARGGGVRLEDLFRWKPIPLESEQIDRGDRESEDTARASAAEATLAAAAAAAVDDGPASGAAAGKPPPGFKIIPGITYSWSAKKQLPEEELMTWQVDARNRVAEMERARGAPGLGSIPGGGDAPRDGVARLGSPREPAVSLPAADRVQMGCYAPGQRVGPCTSNHFVASRFRASVYGIAAMRQAFEDVLYDYEHEFPGPGFEGWSVQNLTWSRDAEQVAHDRPGYPTHAFMYARDGFERSKNDWCCVCSTEEMIYNKMFRRNPGLFAPDAHCDASAPYEEMEKGDGPKAAASASAPRRAGR